MNPKSTPDRTGIEKLVVVNIPSRQIEAQKKLGNKGWYWAITKDPEVFIAETCERSLIVTSKDHWETNLATDVPTLTGVSLDIKDAAQHEEATGIPPYKDGKIYKKSTDFGAYRYLLETSCGMHSNNPGEEFIGKQIQEEFTKYIGGEGQYQGARNSASWLKKNMQTLAHDVALIRTEVTGMYNPVNEARCGIELMKLPQSPSVLIFADNGEALRAYVKELANQSRKDAVKAKNIDIVLLPPLHKDAALDAFFAQQKGQAGRLSLSIIPKDELLENAEILTTYHGIVYLPQYGKNTDIEAALTQVIPKEQNNTSPKILITRALEDELENAPNTIQFFPDSEVAITPQKLAQQLAAQEGSQKDMVRKGLFAAEVVSLIRQANKAPTKGDLITIKNPASQNAEEIVAALLEKKQKRVKT